MTAEGRILWMQEVLQHLGHCYDQWEMADQPHTRRFLSGAVQRDLAEFHRLCLPPGTEAPRRLPK